VRKLTDKVPILGRMLQEPVTSGECRLKQFRAVATRYDKTAASYLAFVQLAASRLWLRFVHTA
jgi:transposase